MVEKIIVKGWRIISVDTRIKAQIVSGAIYKLVIKYRLKAR